MKGILTRVLVFLLLFANLSWVAHAERLALAHEQGGQGTAVLVQETTGWGDAGCMDAGFCDHCCHGGAHYVGVLPETSLLSAAPRHALPHLPCSDYRSRTTQPPLPPPEKRLS